MPPVLENVIVKAVPDGRDYSVSLTWANGSETRSNFAHLAGKGVFAGLLDPATFGRVSVGDNGRSLAWPGELDFCADALWFEAHPEDAPDRRAAAERAA